MYLGIDIGTSAVKAAVIDDSGRRRRSGERAFERISAAALVVRTGSGGLVVGHQHRGRRLAFGAAQGGARHRLVRSDARCNAARSNQHRALRPAILWNDGRSAQQCTELEATRPQTCCGSPATAPCRDSRRLNCCGCGSMSPRYSPDRDGAAAQGLRALAHDRRLPPPICRTAPARCGWMSRSGAGRKPCSQPRVLS